MKTALLSIFVAGSLLAQPVKSPAEKLVYPPLGQVKTPEIQTATLPNGIKLYLMENHALPLVYGTAIVRTGSLFDPAGKVGVGEMGASIMRSGGTKTKTGDQLDEQLENIAATVEASMGDTEASVTFTTLKENADEVMAVFKDVLTQPEFRQDKIDLLKNQFRSAIGRRNDDADAIASREMEQIVYGRDTVFGRQIEYEHVDAITRQDLVAFHSRYYFPANTMLIVQGDFSAADMKQKVEALFADWKEVHPSVPTFPKVDRTKSKPGIYVAEKENVEQTFFEVGHLGGKLNDKDYPATEVALSILGSSFSGRLFNIIRTDKGYAYNVSGSWGAGYLNERLLNISGSASLNRTTDTLEIIRSEIGRMGKEEVTDQELESAKSRVLNSFIFNFDQPRKTLTRMVSYSYYGYPSDHLLSYQKAIAAVTKADVLAAAKRNLQVDKLVYVVVGKTAEFGRPLSDLKLPISKIDLTIPEPKKKSNAKTDAASAAKAKQLLARAQQAMGGAEALAGIKDMTWNVDMNMAGTSLKSKNLFRVPNQFRQEQELPFGKVLVYSDGTTGWMKTPQGEIPMPPEFLTQVRGQIMKLLPTLVMSDRVANRTISLVDDNTVEISEPGNPSMKLRFDVKSGLPNKVSYASAGMQGMVDVEEELDDFRDIGGGVKMYCKQSVTQSGQKATSVLSDYKINTGLTKEALSAKP